MQQEYVSVSRLRVDREKVDELVAAFRARAHLVDDFPGFRRLEVWCSNRADGEVLMVSHWESRADFTSYMKSDAHRHSHARIAPELLQAIDLERLEHVTGYEVVSR